MWDIARVLGYPHVTEKCRSYGPRFIPPPTKYLVGAHVYSTFYNVLATVGSHLFIHHSVYPKLCIHSDRATKPNFNIISVIAH